MPSYVAFLRAINLGPTRKVPMADLRECLTESGLEDVATHIQTGNILLRTRMRSTAAVERHVETALAERYGFEVPTVAFTTPQFRQVYDDAAGATPPHDKVTGERRYVQLFKAGEAPTGEVARAIEAWDRPGEAAVVIGRSNIVGKPVAQLLLAENATVTVAHSKTNDLPAVCRGADLLVAAIGRAEMVRGDWIKPGATVIDVGINRVPGDGGKSRIVGDVAYAEAVQVAGAVTPVPGGVGPMTIACLLLNTLRAACAQKGLPGPKV